jgi:hypothetical protein
VRQIVRRRQRWIGPAIIAAVCLTGVGGSSAAPAAFAGAHQVGPGVARHDTVTARTGSDGRTPRNSVPLPNKKSLVKGVVGLATTSRDTRAKVNLQIPAVIAVAYLDPAYRTPASQTLPVPSYYRPKHPVAGCHYNEGVLDTDLYSVRIKQPDKKKQGVVKSVGRFPATPVSALAFGAIPATATLHTHQVKRHGKLVPLIANTVTSYFSADASGASCDSSWDSGKQIPPLNTVSQGVLAVRISDVRVDKQLVDVGDHCHTATPLHLNLFGRPGYIAYTGGQLVERYDPKTVRAGASTYPLHPGSSNLTIPAFVGCINPHTGEDFSRLITAMVSGPDNTVAVNQSQAILNDIDNKHVSVCDKGMGCVHRPGFVNPPRPGMTVHRRHH